MKSKTKIIICVIVLVALVGGAVAGILLKGSKDDTIIPANESSDSLNSERKFDKDFRVVVVNGVSVISDKDGIRVLRESDGEEKKIYNEPTDDNMLFDGETVYFMGERFKDESVKIDPESIEDESLNPDKVNWERRKMYSYSVSTDQFSELFTTKGYFGEPVYFDNDYLYYSDIADDEVGSYVTFSDSETLYRYDLNTAKSEKLLEGIAWNYYFDGKIIYQTQRGYNGDDGFHDLNVYDIKAQKSYPIENTSMYAYADDSKLYYICYNESEENYTLKSCTFTGEGKTVVSDFDFLPESGDGVSFEVNEQYIHISFPANNDEDMFYNIKTRDVTKTKHLDGELYNYNNIFTYVKPVSEKDYNIFLINGNEDYKLLGTVDEKTSFVKCTGNGYYIQNNTLEIKFSKLNSTGGIADSKVTEAKSVHSAYKNLLEAKKYNGEASAEYALYDFDDDATQELLVWDIRVATAAFRDVFVYKYDAESGDAVKIGKLEVFQGHCHIGESADKNGIAVAVRDTGSDYIKEYYLDNGVIKSKTLLERNGMSSSEWWEACESSKYFSGAEIETVSDYSLIDKMFK